MGTVPDVVSSRLPFCVSITVSTTSDENLIPQMPLSSGAEVLWPRTVASGVAEAMIEVRTLSTLGQSLPVRD